MLRDIRTGLYRNANILQFLNSFEKLANPSRLIKVLLRQYHLLRNDRLCCFYFVEIYSCRPVGGVNIY